MSAQSLAAALIAALDGDDHDRLRELAQDPEARAAVTVLASSRDATARGYAPGAIRVVLGDRGLPLLLKLIDDRDPDVRTLALAELAAISPGEVAKQAPRLRRRIAGGDDWEALSVAWRLALLDDREAVPLIAAYRDRHPPTTAFHKAADVILTWMLEPRAVIDRISAHDHQHMPWLAHAAMLMSTDEARRVLAMCMTSAPDEACRAACQRALGA